MGLAVLPGLFAILVLAVLISLFPILVLAVLISLFPILILAVLVRLLLPLRVIVPSCRGRPAILSTVLVGSAGRLGILRHCRLMTDIFLCCIAKRFDQFCFSQGGCPLNPLLLRHFL